MDKNLHFQTYISPFSLRRKALRHECLYKQELRDSSSQTLQRRSNEYLTFQMRIEIPIIKRDRKNRFSFNRFYEACISYYVKRDLILLDKKSTSITMMMIPSRIIPTLSQSRTLRAKISGVPIPPAPITPKTVAARMFTSRRYMTKEK